MRGNDWLMGVLATVRDADLPDAWVGAGTLRDLVWAERFGAGFDPTTVRDVDVPFFDPDHLDPGHDDLVTDRLEATHPGVPWEAKNQAAVHLWYPAHFGGGPVAPLASIEDALGTWPETATAVAVRRTGPDGLEVCAPLGVDDLLGGVWRRNPRRVSLAQSRARLARHRPATRFPGVTVIPPG